MPPRHPLPTLWLLTDQRQGDALWSALARLPRGSGVIVRHYHLPLPERRKLFERIRKIARRCGLMLLLSGPPSLARAWRADGVYGAPGKGSANSRLVHAATVHDLCEIRAAERAGADLVLLSPLFATRTHPGAPFLGRVRFAALARQSRLPVIALGGVSRRHEGQLALLGAQGWAGIDAFA